MGWASIGTGGWKKDTGRKSAATPDRSMQPDSTSGREESVIGPIAKFATILPRRRLGMSALVFTLMGIAAAGAFLWARYHLHAAERALQRYVLDEAQHHLELCLRVRFRSADVHLLAAQTARRRDDYDLAEQHLQACERLGGVAKAAALERILLVTQEGDLPDMEGLRNARTAADHAESDLVLEALSKGYANRCWQEDALACLNVLLERQPENPQAWLLRARVLQSLSLAHGTGALEQTALDDYERAVQLRPSFEARLGMAGTLYSLGRPEDAALEYEGLLQIQPAHQEVLIGLARTRFNLGDLDEARRLLDVLLTLFPDHPAALLERGLVALHAEHADEAERWMGKAAAAALPCDCDADRLLCRCLELHGKTAEAAPVRDRLRHKEAELRRVDGLVLRANHDSQNLPLRFEAAMSLMRLGREQDGIAALFFVLEQQPQYGPAHAALADYFERTGQPRREARHRRAGDRERAPFLLTVTP